MSKLKRPRSHKLSKEVQLNQAELDQILAPIALYPDSLLSQILVASTYPLEVVQATRWRQANSELDDDQALAAVETKDWDPSVKALAPFEDLLVRISEDLDWLQNVGDAFLQNEDQVLASVQNLRQIAYDNGSIADNDYYEITTEQNDIIIESTQREIVYVPYYDTREVYGNWRWSGYAPIYWDRPRNYVHLNGGYYWNAGYYVRPNIFFGGFHWGSRRLVINQGYYDNNYYGYNGYRSGYNRRIPVSSYTHWSHNSNHRRGVRYPNKIINTNNRLSRAGSSSLRTINRSGSSYTNRRNAAVNKVQQRLNKINRGTRNSATIDRRNSVRPNQQRQTQTRTVRPTVSNSRVISNRTNVNRAQTVNRAAAVNRAASANRAAAIELRLPIELRRHNGQPRHRGLIERVHQALPRLIQDLLRSLLEHQTPERQPPDLEQIRLITPRQAGLDGLANK